MEPGKIGTRVWFDVTRPFAFPASVLALELVAVVLMHAIGNLLNDYYDYRSGADARTEDDEGRPGRFLVKGVLLPKQVLRLVLILCLPLAPIGAYLIWLGGWPVAAIAAVGLFGAYSYTGPPFALKYRRLGELCIFIVYGPAVVIGAGYMRSSSAWSSQEPLPHGCSWACWRSPSASPPRATPCATSAAPMPTPSPPNT